MCLNSPSGMSRVVQDLQPGDASVTLFSETGQESKHGTLLLQSQIEAQSLQEINSEIAVVKENTLALLMFFNGKLKEKTQQGASDQENC